MSVKSTAVDTRCPMPARPARIAGPRGDRGFACSRGALLRILRKASVPGEIVGR